MVKHGLLKHKQYIECSYCAKLFGGPEAGNYNNSGFNDQELEDFLVEHALGFFWIRVQVGTDNVLLCSKQCVNKWLKGWPHQND